MPRNSRARVYIGRLKEGVVSNKDIEGLFLKYGRIVDLTLKSNYGFIEFENEKMADAAVFEMNRKEFMGERIIVEHARPAPDDSGAKKGGRNARARSPSPVRYDSMQPHRPSLFPGPGGISNYSVPPVFSPFGAFNPMMSTRPMMPDIPPFRPFDSQRQDFRGGRDRDWSPRGPRRRSRSRSPQDRNRFKKARRSSPLRVRKRSKSPIGNGNGNGSGNDAKQRMNKFDEPTKTRTNWRICVENLKPNVTWQDLRRHFSEIGEVVYTSVASDASGFVEFSKKENVTDAVSKLNNTFLKGARILVINSVPADEDHNSHDANDVNEVNREDVDPAVKLDSNDHEANNGDNDHCEHHNDNDHNSRDAPPGETVERESSEPTEDVPNDVVNSDCNGDEDEQSDVLPCATNGNGAESLELDYSESKLEAAVELSG